MGWRSPGRPDKGDGRGNLLRAGETGDGAYVVDAATVTVIMRVRGSRVEVAERKAVTQGLAHDVSVVTGYPAQHDSLDTSISKVCAASFKPSTVVRYGKIISPNSVKVRPCLMARTAV